MGERLLLYLIGGAIGIILAKICIYAGIKRQTKKVLKVIGNLRLGSTIQCPLCKHPVAPVPMRDDDIIVALITICKRCGCASTILPPGFRLQDVSFTRRRKDVKKQDGIGPNL